MYQSVRAQVDEAGRVILMEPLHLLGTRNAILTVLGETLPPLPDALDAPVADPWAAYRARLSAAGLRVPAPGAWQARQGGLLEVVGPPVSQTLVEDRR